MTGPDASPVWDGLADLVAILEADRAGDREGFRILLECCDHELVLSVALRLLSQVAAEHNADRASLLAWGFLALDGA